MPTSFDWEGAMTFGHWNFSGPSRVGYSILQTILSCIILAILGFVIKFSIETVSNLSTSSTITTGPLTGVKLEGFTSTVVKDLTTTPTVEVSGPAMFFGFIFSVAAWVWTVSFSAACYEHWRNLEPDNEEQKNKERGIKKTA
jgi:hypothetical protein